jgi:hypothetical protein
MMCSDGRKVLNGGNISLVSCLSSQQGSRSLLVILSALLSLFSQTGFIYHLIYTFCYSKVEFEKL